MDVRSENRKRKQHHSEALSQSASPVQNQAEKMSTRPNKQSKANQLAERLETPSAQTQLEQVPNNTNQAVQQLPNEKELHLEYEKTLRLGFDTALKLIDQLKALVHEKDARILQMQVDNKELNGNVENLNNLKDEIHQRRTEKDKLNDVIVSLDYEKTALQAQVQKIENEKIQMAQRVVDVRNAYARLQAANSGLEEQFQNLKSDKQNLIRMINSDEHTAVKEERQRMRVEKEKLFTNLEMLNKTAANLRSENTTLDKRNTALEADNAKLRARIDDIFAITTARTELLADQRAHINTLTKIAEDFDHEQDGLFQQIDGLNDENRQLKEENQGYHDEQDELYERIEELDHKKFQLRKENRDLHEQVTNLSRQAEQFNRAQDAAHNEQDKLKQQNDQLQYENEQIEEQNDNLHKQVLDLSRQVEKLDQVQNNAHAQIEFHREQDGLRQQVDRLKHENLHLEKQNETLHTRFIDLSRQVEELDQAQDAAHAQIEELQRQGQVDKRKHEIGWREARTLRQAPQYSSVTQTPNNTQKNASIKTSTQTIIGDALKQIESSKQVLTQEIQRNAASEQQLRNIISALEFEKSDLQAQINKVQLEAAELKQATSSKEIKLMDEKMDVYMEWRAEVKDLQEQVQDGVNTNNLLREQIGMFEDQIQDMVAERLGSVTPEAAYAAWAVAVSRQDASVGQEDENDNSEADTNTLVGDSPDLGEQVLNKVAIAGKRRREDEVVKNRVERVERSSRPQSKRVKVE